MISRHRMFRAQTRNSLTTMLVAVLWSFTTISLAAQGPRRHGNAATAALDPRLIGVLDKVATHVLREVHPNPWPRPAPGTESGRIDPDAGNIADYLLTDWATGVHEFRLSHNTPYPIDNNGPGHEEFVVQLSPVSNGWGCPARPATLPAPGTITTERQVVPTGFPFPGQPHERSSVELVYVTHLARIFVDIYHAPPGAAEERALRVATVVHDGMVAEGLGEPCSGSPGAGVPTPPATPATPVTPTTPATPSTPFPLWPVLAGVLSVLGVGGVIAVIGRMLATRSAAGPTQALDTPKSGQHAPNPAATLPISSNDIYVTPVPLQTHQQLATAIAQSLGADCEAFTSARWNANAKSADPRDKAALEARREQVMQVAFKSLQQSMGLRTQVRLVFENDPDGPYAGQYRPKAVGGPELMIDKARSQWDIGPHQPLDTLAHELEHVRQWDPAANLGDATTRAVATKNATDFVKMETDYESYYEQFVERDARAFADVVSQTIARQGSLSRLARLKKTWEGVKQRDSLRSTKPVWELSEDDLRLRKLRTFLKVVSDDELWDRLKPMIGTEENPVRRSPGAKR